MKKFIALLAACCVLFTSCGTSAPAAKGEPDFREITWGMSRKEVKKTEKGQPDFEDDVCVLYDGVRLDGLSTMLLYYFYEDQCYFATYDFNELYPSSSRYIDDYEAMYSLLYDKYGEPDYWDVIWYDTTSRDILSLDESTALSLGELEYISVWSTDTTQIELKLGKEGYATSLRINYFSLTYYPEYKAATGQDARTQL